MTSSALLHCFRPLHTGARCGFVPTLYVAGRQETHVEKLTEGNTTVNFPLEDPTVERVYLAALRAAPQTDRTRHLDMPTFAG